MAPSAQFEADFSDEENEQYRQPPQIESDSEPEQAGAEAEDAAEPGFAQFVDSDDDDGASDSDGPPPPKRPSKEKGKENGKRRASSNVSSEDEDEEAQLKQGLSSIPFGELLKAQQTISKKGGKGNNKKLKRTEPESDSGTESNEESDARRKRKDELKKKRARQELLARRDKNAPTEESSSRPVSRRRQVVDVARPERRDPRFSTLSGQAKKNEFKSQYGFLNEVFSTELKTLKEQYAALTKKERSTSGEQAAAFAAEKENVMRQLNRAQALAAERKRRNEADELDAELKRQNRQRTAEGKKEFYLKKGEKKQLLLRKRYERLAGTAEGSDPSGPGEGSNSKQLRKALERRRKRNAAKERKALPFVADPRRAGAKPKRSG